MHLSNGRYITIFLLLVNGFYYKHCVDANYKAKRRSVYFFQTHVYFLVLHWPFQSSSVRKHLTGQGETYFYFLFLFILFLHLKYYI